MSVLGTLSKASNKSALFVGETIIDVYHYVNPLGRPLKESIVSVELANTERFEGGVQAAAAHALDFCGMVDIDTYHTATVKERWVTSAHVRKLFEVYREEAYDIPRDRLPRYEPDEYDVIIITDYGHGMFEWNHFEEFRHCKYLAVNVQTNSGNYGFNLATKYRHILVPDYLVVDEPEARLATQNRNGPIEKSLDELHASVSDKVVITLGKHGAIGQDDTGTYRASAFTDKVVDTIGAGDAFFAITALIAEDATMPELLEIGNAAGAVKTGIIGHRERVTKDALSKQLGIRKTGISGTG